jgi:predicted lipoprotein
LNALVQEAAQPSVAELAQTAQALADDSAALCRDPDAQALAAARAAWVTGYQAWRRAGPFLFGPAQELSLTRRIGAWPSHGEVLEAVVRPDGIPEAGEEPKARGYAGAEYLLFTVADASAATAARRCNHLEAITGEIAERTGELDRRWRTDYGPEVMAGADAAGTGSEAALEPLERAIARSLNLTENLLWQRTGLPSGFFRGDPRPELLEAPYSQQSKAGLAASLTGLERFLIGPEGVGIASLAAAEDPALAADIARALERSAAEVAGISGTVSAAISADNKRLSRLYDEVQELQNLIRDLVEVAGLRVILTEDGD